MVSLIKSVTFDSTDPLRVAAFWAAALGSDVDEDSTPDRAWVEPAGWGGPSRKRPRTAALRPGADPEGNEFCVEWALRSGPTGAGA